MLRIAGVVEGFYGRPWSWAERERMVDFLGDAGFNYYFYCPKNDPLHRNRWREPYLPEELERFRRLARRCQRLGVELSVGVSPLRFSREAGDCEPLWAKLSAFAAAGVRSFGLLLDDMPMTPAEDQAELANWTWERLREVGADRLTLTPTEYCGSGSSAYLLRLGELLDPAVDVFWTGPDVRSRTLTAEHTRTVAATLRRRPIYWDNYPVNDLESRFDPHLHPIRGREPEVFSEAKGVVWAPGPLAELPKVALLTCAAFADDPVAYDPLVAWPAALLAVAGDEADARALAVLADLSWRTPLTEPALDNRFSAAERAMWAAWDRGERTAAVALMRGELRELAGAAARLRDRLANRPLRREVRPWAEKLAGWTEVGELALRTLERPEPGLRRATLERLRRIRENFHFVLGDQVDEFARRCLSRAGGVEAPAAC